MHNINPIHFIYFTSCGIKFHEVLKRAGHMAEGEASNQFKDDRSASIGWAHGPPDQIKRMCRLIRSYNGCDHIAREASEALDRDLTETIKCIL